MLKNHLFFACFYEIELRLLLDIFNLLFLIFFILKLKTNHELWTIRVGPNHYQVVPLDVIKPRAPRYSFRIKVNVYLVNNPGNTTN